MKAAEAVLKRSVIKTVNKQEQKEKVTKAGVGCDAGMFQVQGTPVAAACAVVSGDEKQAPSLAVFRACNSLAAACAVPEFVTVQLVLPETYEEAELKQMMAEVLAACSITKTTLVQGHTQFSSDVQTPVISVTAMGSAEEKADTEPESGKRVKPGHELVMTKYAGLAGTALLTTGHREELHTRYTNALLDKAEKLYEQVSVQKEAELLAGLGVTSMHDVAEGGVFGAVWEIAERENAGLTLDLKKIPIKQETVEVCEFFDINPYQLRGDGALLFFTDESARVIAELKEAGIPAAVIGHVTDTNDRILKNEDEVRFLEPNRVDEYEKGKLKCARKF